jgi:hypothetical protein
MRVLEQIPKIVAKVAGATSRHIFPVVQRTAESNERLAERSDNSRKDGAGEGESLAQPAKRTHPAVWPV